MHFIFRAECARVASTLQRLFLFLSFLIQGLRQKHIVISFLPKEAFMADAHHRAIKSLTVPILLFQLRTLSARIQLGKISVNQIVKGASKLSLGRGVY